MGDNRYMLLEAAAISSIPTQLAESRALPSVSRCPGQLLFNHNWDSVFFCACSPVLTRHHLLISTHPQLKNGTTGKGSKEPVYFQSHTPSTVNVSNYGVFVEQCGRHEQDCMGCSGLLWGVTQQLPTPFGNVLYSDHAAVPILILAEGQQLGCIC